MKSFGDILTDSAVEYKSRPEFKQLHQAVKDAVFEVFDDSDNLFEMVPLFPWWDDTIGYDVCVLNDEEDEEDDTTVCTIWIQSIQMKILVDGVETDPTTLKSTLKSVLESKTPRERRGLE